MIEFLLKRCEGWNKIDGNLIFMKFIVLIKISNNVMKGKCLNEDETLLLHGYCILSSFNLINISDRF